MNNLDKIEREFDLFMNGIGFARVSQDVGASPIFENADYVNRSNKTIVELKILNTEFFQNGGIIDSLRAMIIKPVSIDGNGLGQYSFQLPSMNREGKYDNFEEPLRRVIKKANKQIKATKSYFFNSDTSTGFIILAQIGLTSLSPEVTGLVVRKILNNEFSAIDGAIICTPYGSLVNPIKQVKNPECVSITKETDLVKKKQCVDIADLWIRFYETRGHQS